VSEKDNGIYDAMNKGIDLAKGDIVGIINSSDYYNADTLQRVADFYAESGFDIMYGDLKIIGKKTEFIKRSKLTKRFNTRFWNHPTTFVAKRVYDEQKYACESIYDDLDFMLRARAKRYKICVLNEVLANFRLGGVSNKRSLKLMKQRVKLRNAIYKRNGCKGYKFCNFVMEFGKYLFAK
jgi:glycosyltransferase involved in cell wall biosynthesis